MFRVGSIATPMCVPIIWADGRNHSNPYVCTYNIYGLMIGTIATPMCVPIIWADDRNHSNPYVCTYYI